MSNEYHPAPDELRDTWINDYDSGMPPESMEQGIGTPRIFTDEQLSRSLVNPEPADATQRLCKGSQSSIQRWSVPKARKKSMSNPEEQNPKFSTEKNRGTFSEVHSEVHFDPEGLAEWIDEVEARWWDNPQNTIKGLPSEEVLDER